MPDTGYAPAINIVPAWTRGFSRFAALSARPPEGSIPESLGVSKQEEVKL